MILLIFNLATGKLPLYELNDWVRSLHLRCIGYEHYKKINFTDDRFGKALDRLYSTDRATLMTRIVLEAIKAFNIDLKQLHNDSTTVKAFGKYPGKASTGFELKNGNSKDHRPDLKQLVFSLSISADGAVPIHYKSYPGNRTDDTTHIETWNTLREINDGPNFLYVADCKVCTDRQLNHISQEEGRVVTLIPDNWKEIGEFKESLRKEQKAKKEIWRRESLNDEKIDYFSLYDGEYLTNKRGYRIHWIFSTGKRKRDYDLRQKRLKKAEKGLEELQSKTQSKKPGNSRSNS